VAARVELRDTKRRACTAVLYAVCRCDSDRQARRGGIQLGGPALFDGDPPCASSRIHERTRNVTAVTVATQKAEPRIRHASAAEEPSTHSAPHASLERDAGRIAREDLRTSSPHDREASRHAADPFHHDDRARSKGRAREAAAECAAPRQPNVVDADGVRHTRGRRCPRAAAAAARGGGKKAYACEGSEPQPVHPMRRIPPNADWLRYVSSKRFVPQASHFASMTWSQPPEPRKNTSPTCHVLAKPSIASAFGL
jgi:hypothetical protein